MQLQEPYKNRIELLQGTLDRLILQSLQWRPRHGYASAQGIRSGSDEVFQVETGSLYPALHLEKTGWLRAAWRTTENRQRARFYCLTAKGKKQLAAGHAKWSQMVEAVAAFSLLVLTEQPVRTWLFLKKSRTSRRLAVQSRSENALVTLLTAKTGAGRSVPAL